MSHGCGPAQGPVGTRWAIIVTVLCALLMATSSALAQNDQALDARQEAALQAYVQLEIERARQILEDAIPKSQAAGASNESLSHAYVLLGVIYVAGMANEEAGAQAFRKALELDPEAAPQTNLSTSAVQHVFVRVQLAALQEASRRQASSPAQHPTNTGETNATGKVTAAQEATGLTAPADDEDPAKPPPPIRFFLRAGPAVGMAYVNSGLPPDRKPPATLSDAELPEHNWDCPSQGGITDRSACTVGVTKAGVVATYALRVEAGWQASPRLSLSGTLRTQFDAGKGHLSKAQLGLRLGYVLIKPSTLGWHLAMFLEGTLGQIQPDPARASPDPKPHIKSGPSGASLGWTLGYRFKPHVGVFLTPQVSVLFPDILFNLDISMGPTLWF